MVGVMRSAACAAVLIASTALAHAQSAPAPSFSVGDTWTRKNRDISYTILVVKVEEGGTWFSGGVANCPGCLSFYDKNLTLLKLTKADGSDVDVTQLGFVPLGSDWRFFDFPLAVKKNWPLDAAAYWRGSTARYQADISVRAYEDVKTPAGTFKAYRIDRNWKFSAPSARPFDWSDTTWYVPEVKLDVKYETSHPLLKAWELTSFSVK